MLRGELHNRGSAGRCEACGEIFPCPTALAILAAVKSDVQQLTSSRRVTDGAHCPACGSVNIGESNIRPAGWLDPRSCRDCHVTFDSSRRKSQPTMTTVHLHRDDVPDTLALLGALLADRSKLPEGYILSTTGADVDWDLLAESWLSTTEKAVVHIAHGCAILERHGGGLPLELRLQVRAAVESTTE